MNKFLNGLKELDNFTETENGAAALKSTGNRVLDAFGILGAMRNRDEEDIIKIFDKAFNEDSKLAMRLLFYIRDIRGGQGERKTFRVIVKHLAEKHPILLLKNLDNFLFYGRGDDVLCLLDTPISMDVIQWIGDVLEGDIITVEDHNAYPTMLAKWLPSENASSLESKRYARMIAKGLNWTPKHYRKILSLLRNKIGIVETLMSQNKWENINFDTLPSRAAMIYSDAFMTHVQDNYIEYLKSLANGTSKINARTLYPYDIAHRILHKNVSLKDTYLLEAMWKALPNYFEDTEETGMCVVDTSGSMHGQPMEVAYSLGMYCADKAKGPFHNHFITFSKNPTLQEITGDNIVEKFKSMDLNICENTNIEKVFDLILRTALINNLKQEELPSKLYIISDMQWDECVYDNSSKEKEYWGDNYNLKPETFISTMRKRFALYGYNLPAIVYWNVRTSDCGMFQQGSDEDNCCMVSGFSPSLFKSVINGTEFTEEEVITETGETKVIEKQNINPMTVMLNTLNNERYDRVVTYE